MRVYVCAIDCSIFRQKKQLYNERIKTLSREREQKNNSHIFILEFD